VLYQAEPLPDDYGADKSDEIFCSRYKLYQN
jgi:hypothetical protein